MPRKGPTTILMLLDMTKYPIPSPFLESGTISATIPPPPVVAIPKPIPCKKRRINRITTDSKNPYKTEIIVNKMKEATNINFFPNRSIHEPKNGLIIIADAKKKVLNKPATEAEDLNSLIAAEGRVTSKE